jgi:hypothetical protein
MRFKLVRDPWRYPGWSDPRSFLSSQPPPGLTRTFCSGRHPDWFNPRPLLASSPLTGFDFDFDFDLDLDFDFLILILVLVSGFRLVEWSGGVPDLTPCLLGE